MNDDTISALHERDDTAKKIVEPNEGERTLLCSNESGRRSPSLDLEAGFTKDEINLLKELADIVAEALTWHIKHGESKPN